jgi:hypothetical protein
MVDMFLLLIPPAGGDELQGILNENSSEYWPSFEPFSFRDQERNRRSGGFGRSKQS